MNNGGPAFPVPDQFTANGEAISQGCFGMSLRDYFAAKAMQALIETDSWHFHETSEGKEVMPPEISKEAYALADAMLKAREPQYDGDKNVG